MTCADFVPLSAVATIFDGQSENTGAETSINEKDISFTTGEKSLFNLELKTNEV